MLAKTRYIAELPAGYDERTVMTLRDDKGLMVTHPEHPPLLLQANGQWLDLNSRLVHPAQSSSTC